MAPPADAATVEPGEELELEVRTLRKDGKQVVTLRAVQRASGCTVECEVYPVSGLRVDPLNHGPYAFATPGEATGFLSEAVLALTHLGCTEG